MTRCLVNGCKNSHVKNVQGSSLHGFPNTPDKIKAWLLATGDHFENIESVIQHIMQQKKATYLRICSDHFVPEMFYETGKRKFLKNDAVPTIFPKQHVLSVVHDLPSTGQKSISPIEVGEPTYSSDVASTQSAATANSAFIIYDHNYVSGQSYILPPAKRLCSIGTNTFPVLTSNKCISTTQYYGRKNTLSQTESFYLKRHTGTSTIDLCSKRDVYTWTGVYEEPVEAVHSKRKRVLKQKQSGDQQLNNPEKNIIEEMDTHPPSTILQAPEVEEDMVCTPNSQISSIHRESEMESTMSAAEFCDPDFSSEDESTDIGEFSYLAEPTPEDYVSERKFIVFESCLNKLLQAVQSCTFAVPCTSPITHREIVITGTLVTVYTVCESNHRCVYWKSQPMIDKQPVGNILASASILFSGSNFSKASELFDIFGVPFISQSLHYMFQNKLLFPTVDMHYKKERRLIIKSLKGQVLCLRGDLQYDSPGFKAKSCTYALREETTQKIIESNTIQVSEKSSSVAMASTAFTMCMDHTLAEKLLIAILVTDKQLSIQKILQEKYKKINHQFDVLHYCKKLRRKLSRISKQRIYRDLAPWKKSIINHMWTACSTCRGNPELLREKWNTVLHHVINEHECLSGSQYHQCDHRQLTDSDVSKRKWLNKNGMAYSKLESFVTDPILQKDLTHMADFCHTGNLEVFHSYVQKYRPKQVHFSMDGLVARTQLAVLSYNANVDQRQATVQRAQKGTRQVSDLRYRPYYSKRTKTKQNYDLSIAHIYPMVSDVIRLASGDLEANWKSRRRLLQRNIASKLCLSTRESAENHV
ncbi:uncharacterized protein LOC134579437 [Pelobates fuscus]|uniref:uncharacterized protein LOC134579437 n=1 Tax=Pelobates fuscus TaxID=191477 RepID=UPI002FE454B8